MNGLLFGLSVCVDESLEKFDVYLSKEEWELIKKLDPFIQYKILTIKKEIKCKIQQVSKDQN